MNLRQNQKGFTIVELLIVVVVIAILAAISIVAYTGITNRANNSTAMETANSVKSVATAFNGSQGKYPVSKSEFVNGFAASGGSSADAIAKLPSDIVFITTTMSGASAAIQALSGSNAPKSVAVIPCGTSGFRIFYKDFDSTASAAKSMDAGDCSTAPAAATNSIT